MRLGLGAAADLNSRRKVLCGGDDRDRMANIAFQAYGFLVGIQMLTIMAAETASRINMTDVIRMGIPIDFLLHENGICVNGLQFLNSVSN